MTTPVKEYVGHASAPVASRVPSRPHLSKVALAAVTSLAEVDDTLIVTFSSPIFAMGGC